MLKIDDVLLGCSARGHRDANSNLSLLFKTKLLIRSRVSRANGLGLPTADSIKRSAELTIESLRSEIDSRRTLIDLRTLSGSGRAAPHSLLEVHPT